MLAAFESSSGSSGRHVMPLMTSRSTVTAVEPHMATRHSEKPARVVSQRSVQQLFMSIPLVCASLPKPANPPGSYMIRKDPVLVKLIIRISGLDIVIYSFESDSRPTRHSCMHGKSVSYHKCNRVALQEPYRHRFKKMEDAPLPACPQYAHPSFILAHLGG